MRNVIAQVARFQLVLEFRGASGAWPIVQKVMNRQTSGEIPLTATSADLKAGEVKIEAKAPVQ